VDGREGKAEAVDALRSSACWFWGNRRIVPRALGEADLSELGFDHPKRGQTCR